MVFLRKLTKNKVFIIAEAGVNHNGDPGLAKHLIDVARQAGADAVKFQTWKEGECTGKFATKVNYLDTDDRETRYDISGKLRLDYGVFEELQRYAAQKEILFLSTPDGCESLDFLSDQLDLPIIKVSSTEMTHYNFLKAVGRKQKPVILSTGMSTLGEVEKAHGILMENGAAEVVILHCTSEYPAPDDEINVRAVKTIQSAFQVDTGLSDHSQGHIASLMAVALGAVVIEKHFTISKDMDGPDHKASLDPGELKEFIHAVRRAESMLGTGIKYPSPAEQENIRHIRRGVVAAGKIKKGDILGLADLRFKRPLKEIEPGQADILAGMTVNRDLEPDEPICWKDVK